MQSEDKIIYLLRTKLESAIEDTEERLARRRVKPTGISKNLLFGESAYYIETESLRNVLGDMDKLLSPES